MIPSLPPCAIVVLLRITGEVEPRSASLELSSFGVRRRVVPEQLRRVRREAEHRVAPVCVAVPGSVPGGDEQVTGARVDHRAGASPDGGVARPAGGGVEQPGPVGAERVPDVQQRAARRVDHGHMALVRRRVADVAAGGGDHVPLLEVQGRGDLLARRQPRDRDGPHGVAVRDRELRDRPARRRGVDGGAARIRDRRRRRDLRRAGPRRVARRRDSARALRRSTRRSPPSSRTSS